MKDIDIRVRRVLDACDAVGHEITRLTRTIDKIDREAKERLEQYERRMKELDEAIEKARGGHETPS